MKFFASLPLPVAGIALATASLGRLLGAYAVFLQDLCGLTAAALLVCLLLRYVKSPLYKEEKENPLTAPIIPLLPMTILALSGYGSELHPVPGLCLWYIGFLWHGWYILDFTERTLRNFRLERVLPSWFVVYVGIVISVITMPLTADGTIGAISSSVPEEPFSRIGLVTILLAWGLTAYIFIGGLIFYRLRYIPLRPFEIPTLVIFSAPPALCLSAYVHTVGLPDLPLLIFLSVSGLFFYICSLVVIIRFWREQKFYPTMASFTFPLVIFATAARGTSLALLGPGPYAAGIAAVTAGIAAVVTAGTGVGFVQYMRRQRKFT